MIGVVFFWEIFDKKLIKSDDVREILSLLNKEIHTLSEVWDGDAQNSLQINIIQIEEK